MKIIVFSRTKKREKCGSEYERESGQICQNTDTACCWEGLGSRGLGQTPEATGMVMEQKDGTALGWGPHTVLSSIEFCTSISNRYK